MDDGPSRTPGGSRLRDYGALQADISTLVTREMGLVEMDDRSSPRPEKRGEQEHRQKAENNLPSFSYGSRAGTPLPAPAPRFAGVVKIIPFRTQKVSVREEQPTGGPNAKTAETGEKAKGKRVAFVVRLGLTVLLLVFLSRSVSWSTLFTSLAHIRRSIMLVSFVVGASGIVLSAYQWRSLLQGEGIRLDLAELINLYVIGIAFSHFLPTGMGGDTVKAFYVGRKTGNSAGSVSAVVLCRFTGFVGMLLLALPAIAIWHARLSQPLVNLFWLLSLLVGCMLCGAMVAVGILPRIVKGKWTERRLFSSVMRVGNTLLIAMKRPRFMCWALLYGIVFWLVAVLNCYAYAVSIGIEVPFYFYYLVVPLIALISFLPISINGFGLRESAYVYAFATMHVAASSTLLLALVLDAQALLFGVIGGCVYFTLSGKARMARLPQSSSKSADVAQAPVKKFGGQ